MTRRDFVNGLGAVGAFCALPSFAAESPKLDPDKVLLLADLHVPAEKGVVDFQSPRLRKFVAEILSEPTLPATCIVFGDIAYLRGVECDYLKARACLKPLADAGVRFLFGMGNHDRRAVFSKVFPEHAKTLVADRIVNLLETERADFLMLDTLQEHEKPGHWITPGQVNREQKAFLKEFLPGRTKPLFVCSHHAEGHWQVRDILASAPCVRGYIHGHEHGWKHTSDLSPRGIRRLGLPTTGHWGDVGYAVMTLSSEFASVKCRATEYYTPAPPAPDKVPLLWKLRPKEIDGACFHFVI